MLILRHTLSYGASYVVFSNTQNNPAVSWSDAETEAGIGLTPGPLDSTPVTKAVSPALHYKNGCGRQLKQDDWSL